jgi:tRNA1Val (adenine37-N6)-methyltransferase
MARRVYEDLVERKSQVRKALDLCSGCGIIGLDFIFHSKNSVGVIETFDFMEVQNEYQSYFNTNCKTLLNDLPEISTRLNFLNLNYEDANKTEKFKNNYDLIVCNPPYFLTSQGKMSEDVFKNRCRFFIDSDLKNLIQFIEHSLADKGSAYLIFHDLKDHKINLMAEIQSLVKSKLTLEILPAIRKSEFIRLTK